MNLRREYSAPQRLKPASLAAPAARLRPCPSQEHLVGEFQ